MGAATMQTDDLDKPVYGAEAIAIILNMTKNGAPDTRRAYHALEKGYVDATKLGRQWISTPRRLLRRFAGEAA
jgi:hypothetical protein